MQCGCLTCRASEEDSNEDHSQKSQRKVSCALFVNGRRDVFVNVDKSDQERLVKADMFFVKRRHGGRGAQIAVDKLFGVG